MCLPVPHYYSHVCHDSFICVAWLIIHHMYHVTHTYESSYIPCLHNSWYVCHDSLICVPWLIHMCGMTHSHVKYYSFIYVTWFIYMCAMTHPYVCHEANICWIKHILNDSTCSALSAKFRSDHATSKHPSPCENIRCVSHELSNFGFCWLRERPCKLQAPYPLQTPTLEFWFLLFKRGTK